MRFGCCAVLAFSACYAPQVTGGAPCDLSRDSCPTGQTCQAAGNGNFCTNDGSKIDAGRADAVIIQGPTCYGSSTGLLGSVCFANEPIGAVTLASMTINTASVGTGNCTEIRAQAGGPSICIIAANTITVASGAVVRAIGPNPVVLVAAQTLTVSGTLDAASHITDLPGVTGAGARTALACNAVGIDGTIGNAAGGGGGAGGSFGGQGGAGGDGRTGAPHGNPAPASRPTALMGGCPGGRGGDGNNDMNSNPPFGGGFSGAGGGAIYLIAGGTITVAGSINASGAGGGGGLDGFNNSGGGGGGGAGGMIGLDAPHMMITGSVYANGGGGGGGGGSTILDHGRPGADPVTATVAASGGAGGQDNGSGTAGGNGGAGSVGITPPGTGKVGTQVDSAGGAGGGGAGIIRVFGVPATSLGGAISPPPS